jgi:hypothetical protein
MNATVLSPLTAGIIRWCCTLLGGWLVKHGVDQAVWDSASPYVSTILGALFALGSLAWNIKTHTRSGVGAQLASLKPGPEGQTPPQI